MNEKKKWKWNLFDIGIVVLILVIAAGGYWFLNRSTPTSSNTQTLRYTVVLNAVPNQMEEALQVGDALTESTKNYSIGTLVDFRVEEATDMAPNYAEHKYMEKTIPEQKKLFLMIEAQAVESNSAFTISGSYQVKPGETIAVKGPGYAAEGMILSIEREGV